MRDRREYHSLRRKQLRKFIDSIKESHACEDCGNFYPAYVMDFDHVRGQKSFSIGTAIGTGTLSKDALRAEIAKCEIVCANCHRERTHYRKSLTLKAFY